MKNSSERERSNWNLENFRNRKKVIGNGNLEKIGTVKEREREKTRS